MTTSSLPELRAEADRHGCIGSVSLGSATVIILVALTIIGCSCACLALPGVNAMTQIVKPVILPCLGALLLSIPLIRISVWREKSQANVMRIFLDKAKKQIDEGAFSTKLEPARREWFVQTILNGEKSGIRGENIISKLEKLYPKEDEKKTDDEKRITKGLEKIKAWLKDSEWAKELEKAKEKIDVATDLNVDRVLEIIEETDARESKEKAVEDLLDYYPENGPIAEILKKAKDAAAKI
ncbi:MAG: hypothetical protein S4CHLAM45_09910 [Chlamydiales bacterium]|nr:hypothetical protein [Chlamydiales bacterium]MCH9620193.1 hypothetical protein [Chlamydiales bacterium]MCH9623092.1 hypothetical protein [Chlamydiales bacterium]